MGIRLEIIDGFRSGWRESNSRSKLGKLLCYHYNTPANRDDQSLSPAALAPPELNSSAPPVAVRTPYVAFLDLGAHARPAPGEACRDSILPMVHDFVLGST